MENKTIGDIGEILGVRFLKEKKYKILHTKYRMPFGEIDIVAKKDNTIVFVEVKARASKKFGMPKEAITFAKMGKIKMVAQSYLKRFGLQNCACRFDCLEILGSLDDFSIEHYENIL